MEHEDLCLVQKTITTKATYRNMNMPVSTKHIYAMNLGESRVAKCDSLMHLLGVETRGEVIAYLLDTFKYDKKAEIERKIAELTKMLNELSE